MQHIKKFSFLESILFGISSSLTFGQLKEQLCGPRLRLRGKQLCHILTQSLHCYTGLSWLQPASVHILLVGVT